MTKTRRRKDHARETLSKQGGNFSHAPRKEVAEMNKKKRGAWRGGGGIVKGSDWLLMGTN